MKKYLSSFLFTLLFFACDSAKNDGIRLSIPGTYARFSDHQMRREYDTLKIEMISGTNYTLLRLSSFQRKLDGKILPWEHTKEEWAAVYDDNKKVLNETRKGKLISFLPERNLLMIGTTEYKKLKWLLWNVQ